MPLRGDRLLCESLEKETRRPTLQEKGDWKPIIFIFTSGETADSWKQAAADLKSKYYPKIIAVACRDGVNFEELCEITGRVYELGKITAYDLSKIMWEDWDALAAPSRSVRESLLPAPSSSVIGSILPTKAGPSLGAIFQSAVDSEVNPEIISQPPPSISSEPSPQNAKPKSQTPLSKLFTDGENNP